MPDVQLILSVPSCDLRRLPSVCMIAYVYFHHVNGIVNYLQKSDVMLDGKNYKAWAFTLWMLLRGLGLWGVY